MLFATAIGGRIYGKEEDEAETNAEVRPQAPGSRTFEVCRSEQPDFSEYSADLRSCDSGIHLVVLVGAEVSVQQDRGFPVQDSSRTAALCIPDHQFAARGSPKAGVRGGGLRAPERRSGSWNSPRERCQTIGYAGW